MRFALTLLFALLLIGSRVAAQDADRIPPRLVSPTVVLAYDDTGAFGPQTPGTKECAPVSVYGQPDCRIGAGFPERDAVPI
jgi:hypothetical protein